FLAVKVYEYYQKSVEHHIPGPSFSFPAPYTQPAKMYFTLYFAMTGLHAAHMIVGCGLLTVLIVMAWRGRFTPEYHSPVEISGLYWHFVDIIWIFLYPLLYLTGRHVEGGIEAMPEHIVPIKPYAESLAALLVLTATTCGVSFIDMGKMNAVVAVVIAFAKASLVALIF